MTTPNRCQFWDCAEIIRRNHFLCALHYEGYEMGLINQCPSCGQYKDAEYDVCLVCYRQPAAAPRVSVATSAPRSGASDAALLEELRGLRRSMARRDGLQEFMVFSNDTLEQFATMRPATAEAMLTVNGVGPVKMERFGWDFLRVIREYANQPQTTVHATGARAGVQPDAAASRPQTPGQVAEHQTDDPRKRWPAKYRTLDGHYVRSRAEWMIDVWLSHHHIAHDYERKLPVLGENAISDFYLRQGNVYIEFWGKEDDPAYARRKHEKKEIYQRNNLKLISLTDDDLYNLDDRM